MINKQILSVLLSLFSLVINAQIETDSANIVDIENRLTEFRKAQYKGIILQVIGGSIATGIGIMSMTTSGNLEGGVAYIIGGGVFLVGTIIKITSYHKLKKKKKESLKNSTTSINLSPI